VEAYRAKARALYQADQEEIAEARRGLGEARRLKAPAARQVEKELAELIAAHRLEVLELGAPAPLLAEGLLDVAALDEEEALEEASPHWKGGRLRLDPGAIKAREEAMAKRLAAAGPLAVVLLGGAHDLTEATREHAPRVRYVRVTSRAYREASGER
jgi:hypothetical protein